MPVATGYSRLSDTPGATGYTGIEGGRSRQGARGPVWDSRDAGFGWATALEDWALGLRTTIDLIPRRGIRSLPAVGCDHNWCPPVLAAVCCDPGIKRWAY
eukprot:285727-Rhodomonas_salina.2